MADVCPNAALRQGASSNLPDCRAYELVTPPFMNGQFPFVFAVGADASHLLFSTLGAPGEAADDPTAGGAAYKAGRTASGWSATPLNPSAALWEMAGNIGTSTGLQGTSSDYSGTLLIEFPAAESTVLGGPADARVVIRAGDGSFPEVGPVMPPAAIAAYHEKNGNGEPQGENWSYLGASADLSHVVFDTRQGTPVPGAINWHWPGDTTLPGASSLYEYVGTGHTGNDSDLPALVAVDNEGHLIGQCGAGLGAGAPDGYMQESRAEQNAISRDGAAVFFTVNGPNQPLSSVPCAGAMPPAAELYARLDGSRTVAISEPTTTGPNADCTACDISTPQDATYQGASQDGSRVIFLSNQKLLAAAFGQSLYQYNFHPQDEGHAPSEKVTLLATDVLGVTRLSEDGTHLYYVAQGAKAESNLYVREPDPAHPGQTRTVFIATLSSSDAADWRIEDNRPVEATPDGRYLLFASTNDLTPDAFGTGRQLYRYDSQTGQLARVTIGEDGFNANGNNLTAASFPEPRFANNPPKGPPRRSMSDDGAYVFFESTTALTPRALNHVCVYENEGSCQQEAGNVYEFHLGRVYLISDGQDRHSVFNDSASHLIGTTASGADVFFETADPLATHDTNTQRDIYDARIGGGFPAPLQPGGCLGEACQGPPAVAPAAQTPASALLTGQGNLAPQGVAKPVKPAASERAAKLARALKQCRRKHRSKRKACERQARRRYAKTTRRRARAGAR
jgi:hypothetical protein